MDWSDFSGKKIGLLGAGKENLSLIPLLEKAGADITVCDDTAPTGSKKSCSVGECLDNLTDFHFVFRTPGMPVATIQNKLPPASNRPIVTSATDLLLALKGHQIVAVTGTKGKGTTATMITAILRSAGRDVMLAGNIGNSIFEDWEKITDRTVVVMELSSFQLEDIKHGPHVAVLLPITADHLQPLSERSPNFHKDLPAYIAAKQQITANQGPDDHIVFSLDSQASAQIGQSSLAKKTSVSAKTAADILVRDGVIRVGQAEIDLAKETKLRGDHLFHNAALATAVAVIYGVKEAEIAEGLRDYQPLPHRMEPVGVFNGIEFVDDSYATAPDATIAALSAFPDKPVVLILGGSSKGADFTELAQAARSVKAVVLIGQEAGRIEAALKEFAPSVVRLGGLQNYRDAIETAFHRASPGDVVLLSPACASKDMFKDAAERGEIFKKYIHELV